MHALKIGQLAKRAGVGIETVRFYERRGLLEEPPRKKSGYRQYPPESLSQLRFIRRAKRLGFSLREIEDLLSLRGSKDPCPAVRAKAEAKILDIEGRLEDLERMKQGLEKLVACCEDRDSLDRCPILEALEREG